MTPDTTRLAKRLQREAVDATEHPADAVTALMSAAATILRPTHGEDGALSVMTLALDNAAAAWRAEHAN